MSSSIIGGLLNRSLVVEANIITCTKLFRLNPIYENPNGRGLLDIFTTTVGYHGTTEGQIESQLEDGKFENIGKRIYVADKETATSYALKRAERDGTAPIVLKIYSRNKAEMNEISTSSSWSGMGGLGLYRYFPPSDSQEVYIEKAYKVADHN